MIRAWLELPLIKNQRVKVNINNSDLNWLKKQSDNHLDYINYIIRKGNCNGHLVGEVSSHTLNHLVDLINPDCQEDILETITKETGVCNWGLEGSITLNIDLYTLHNKRLREIKLLCQSLSQNPHRILKGIILKEKGYIVYDSYLPKKNRLAIIKLREIIRNKSVYLSVDKFSGMVVYSAINKLSGNIHDW
jgi:hypothetical protein